MAPATRRHARRGTAEQDVVDSLLADAHETGAALLCGKTTPALIRPLSLSRCWFDAAQRWVLISSGRPDIRSVLQDGHTVLSRLGGEYRRPSVFDGLPCLTGPAVQTSVLPWDTGGGALLATHDHPTAETRLKTPPARRQMNELNGLRVFSTCAPSNKCDRATYLDQVVRVARWSEEAGCEGILVYTDNGLVDPWLLAQVIVENTDAICPLVAVQPVYMHPYSAAKMIATIGYLYGRRTWLNMVAGGFKNDLLALGDESPHDRRYDRVVEYATIVQRLLEKGGPVSFDGDFYRVDNLRMTPPLDPGLRPGITLSGSSDAGLAAARRLGAVAVQYPRPVHEYEQKRVAAADLDVGIRIGIIAREDGDEAWRIAHERFPEDRSGQLAHQLAMKVSDSVWHRQLSELGRQPEGEENPYWLVPFENYKTFCPYLVGTYDTVAVEVARYRAVGYETFILDVPASPEELEHIRVVFSRAAQRAG